MLLDVDAGGQLRLASRVRFAEEHSMEGAPVCVARQRDSAEQAWRFTE